MLAQPIDYRLNLRSSQITATGRQQISVAHTVYRVCTEYVQSVHILYCLRCHRTSVTNSFEKVN